MRTFIDTQGRTWAIRLTLGTLRDIQSKLGINLLMLHDGDPPLITRLISDQLLVGELICALLEKQFEEKGMTEADMNESFDGKTLLAASSAFFEELMDFFQGCGRPDMAEAIKARTVMVGAMIARTMQAVTEQVEIATVGTTSTDLPESSESTPTESHLGG